MLFGCHHDLLRHLMSSGCQRSWLSNHCEWWPPFMLICTCPSLIMLWIGWVVATPAVTWAISTVQYAPHQGFDFGSQRGWRDHSFGKRSFMKPPAVLFVTKSLYFFFSFIIYNISLVNAFLWFHCFFQVHVVSMMWMFGIVLPGIVARRPGWGVVRRLLEKPTQGGLDCNCF